MQGLRCNKCFTDIEHSKRPFSLTQCGHVYCYQCVTQAAKQCFVCHSGNVRTVPLEDPLHPTISLYFTPIKESLEQIQRAASFQDGQHQNIVKILDQMEKKYKFAKDSYRNLEVGAMKMYKQCKREKEEDKKIIAKLQSENTQLKYALESMQKKSFCVPRSVQSDNTSPARDSSHFGETLSRNNSQFVFRTPSNSSTRRSSVPSTLNSRKYHMQFEHNTPGIFQNSSVKDLFGKFNLDK